MDDIMPDMKPRQLKQKSKPEAAENGREEREAQTFRQYFKYDHPKNLRICNVHLENNHPTGIPLFSAALRQMLAEWPEDRTLFAAIFAIWGRVILCSNKCSKNSTVS